MPTKTYWFKADHTDATTGLVWRAGVTDRVTDEDLQDRLEAATGAAGERVVIDLGANFITAGDIVDVVRDGDFNAWPLSADVLTFLEQADQATMRTAGLGAGIAGSAAFAAANGGAFQSNAQQILTTGSMADDTAMFFEAQTTIFGGICLWVQTNAARAGMFSFRIGGASNLACDNIVDRGNGGATYSTGAPPAGTSGNDGTVNWYAANNNRLYPVNRTGGTINIRATILRIDGGVMA